MLLDTLSHTSSFSPRPPSCTLPPPASTSPQALPTSGWKQVAAPRPASRRSPSGWNTPALTWDLAPQETVPRHPSPDPSPAGLLLPRDLCIWGGECWQLTGFLPSETEPLPPHKEDAWPGSSGDSPPAAWPSLTLSESALQAPQVPHPALARRCTGPTPIHCVFFFFSLLCLSSSLWKVSQIPLALPALPPLEGGKVGGAGWTWSLGSLVSPAVAPPGSGVETTVGREGAAVGRGFEHSGEQKERKRMAGGPWRLRL